jgi:tetratricopeptide (TPR) repeat protein
MNPICAVERQQEAIANPMKTSSSLSRSRFIPTFCAIATLVAGVPGINRGQDYLGASAVLRQAEERNAKPAEKQEKDEAAILRDDLKTFSLSETNLAPADAARHWLELVDRAIKIQRHRPQDYNRTSVPIQAADLLAVLPPPAVWNELSKAIAARPPARNADEVPKAGLRLLAAALTGDAAARNREFAALQVKAKAADLQSAYMYRSVLMELGQATLRASDDPDALLKSLGYQLAYSNGEGVGPLEMPNLVSLIGPAKTEAFLRRALVTPDVSLQFQAPNETSRLAQKLALELVDQLKTPQWSLVNSLDAVDLYEAMDKRFGAGTNNLAALTGVTNDIPDVGPSNPTDDNQRQTAEIYYLLGLISRNRTADAVAVASKFKGRSNDYYFTEAYKAMVNAGYANALDNFLNALLSKKPSLPFWDEYVEVAAHAGQTERMVALVRATASRAELSDSKKNDLHQILFKALLAADDVDGAMQEARQLIALDAAQSEFNGYNAGQVGVIMARLGILLQRPELVDEGIGAAKKWMAKPEGRNSYLGQTAYVAGALAQILLECKRGPEAEAILSDALAKAGQPEHAMEENYSWNQDGIGRRILGQLALLYYKAGRYDDVLILLEQLPDWGAKDLSDLFNSCPGNEEVAVMSLHTGSSSLPIPYLAAGSLAARGRKEEARKINNALLDEQPGLDRGYELLLSMDGTNAIRQLDVLFARDQFEERPLIWKAHLLRQQRQLDQAEKTIRQAIGIDPSDGEEGRGDRMRAYAELADILEARGDKKEADTYREVVKAIRLSEDADQFYMAGLLNRAIAMYEEALNHFSDAYCIQSRLAIQLAALGKIAEAEEHYRRAYELMPDSFGRVESHCFGCEKAFDGERAQSIAEKVFVQLAARRPDKPQVHYLLGYLRQEQERYNAALTNYLAAVRLDPEYLNAWVKAQDVSEQTLMPARERDDIVFSILRLDPAQRHAHPQFNRVTDLQRLWQAVAAADALRPQHSTNLFALAASTEALKKKEQNASSDRQKMQLDMIQEMREARDDRSPAAAVQETPFVRVAGEMLMNYGGYIGD